MAVKRDYGSFAKASRRMLAPLAEAGEDASAKQWLEEAERLMSLPVYYASGWAHMLHEKVKGARLQKPTPDEVRQLEAVRTSLCGLANAQGETI